MRPKATQPGSAGGGVKGREPGSKVQALYYAHLPLHQQANHRKCPGEKETWQGGQDSGHIWGTAKVDGYRHFHPSMAVPDGGFLVLGKAIILPFA